MIKNLKGRILQKEEMKQISGAVNAASFPCTCVGADGTVVQKEVSTIQECWDAC